MKRPSRPHIHEKPTPKGKAIDHNSASDVTPREWPNEVGVIVSNPLLGEGYYSDSSGLPGGGLSVSEWRKKKKKKRQERAKKTKKIMSTLLLAKMYLKIAQNLEKIYVRD